MHAPVPYLTIWRTRVTTPGTPVSSPARVSMARSSSSFNGRSRASRSMAMPSSSMSMWAVDRFETPASKIASSRRGCCRGRCRGCALCRARPEPASPLLHGAPALRHSDPLRSSALSLSVRQWRCRCRCTRSPVRRALTGFRACSVRAAMRADDPPARHGKSSWRLRSTYVLHCST